MTTHGDNQPVARREGNPTEAWGGQFQSSMSVHNTGNGKHPSNPAQGKSEKGNQYHVPSAGHGNADDQIGQYEGANHDPPSTQARGSQDPSAMSAHNYGYGNEYKGQYKGANHDPPSTQAWGSQDPSAMSAHNYGYGNAYKGHDRYTGGVHEPSLTQARGIHDPSSMIHNSTGYGNQLSNLAPLTQAPGSKDPSAMSGHSSGYGNAYKGHGGRTGGVHNPPSTQARGSQDPSSVSVNSSAQEKSGKENQSHVSSTGQGTADVQFGRHGNGYEGANYDPRSTKAQGSQDPSSGYGNGYEEPSTYQGPPSTQEWGSRAPSSMPVDRSGYEKASSTPAKGKPGRGNQSHVSPSGYADQFEETKAKPSLTSSPSHAKEHTLNPPPTAVKSHFSSPVAFEHHQPLAENTGNQPKVSSTGYGTDYDRIEGKQCHVSSIANLVRELPPPQAPTPRPAPAPAPRLSPAPVQRPTPAPVREPSPPPAQAPAPRPSPGPAQRPTPAPTPAPTRAPTNSPPPKSQPPSAQKPPPTEVTRNQTHVSFPGYVAGDPQPQPTSVEPRVPGSVGGSGYPSAAPIQVHVNLQLTPAPASGPSGPTSTPINSQSTKPNPGCCPCCSIL